MKSPFVAAAIIQSPDPKRLAKFYREVLMLPFDPSDHRGDTEIHYDCQLGDVHVAIYPLNVIPSARGTSEAAAGAVRIHLAFAYVSLDEVLEHLRSLNHQTIHDPVDLRFGRKTAVHDPDGNLVELIEITPHWGKHLRSRPPHERDITHHLNLE